MNLKELLGESFKEGMSFDDINKALEGANLADLSKGGYVSSQKFTDLETKFNNINTELGTTKTAFENEKAKYSNYISQDVHNKVIDELNIYKTKEDANRKNEFLKSLGCKDKYQSLVSNQLDWNNVSYDEEKKTFVGEGFDEKVKSLKANYSDLFETEESNSKQINNSGYYKQDNPEDLTKL